MIVRSPERASIENIQKLVNKNISWILKNQKEAKRKCSEIKHKEFINGEEFLYMGDICRLLIVEDTDIPLTHNNGNFYLAKEYTGKARELFAKWYKEQALRIISERVVRYSSIAGLKYNKIKITNARKRWGSCGTNDNLYFSRYLIMAPLSVIDYVVVHELAHIKEKNHSKRFWNEIKALFPEYKKHKKLLRENGHILTI